MLIAGNWKMFKTPSQAAGFCRELRESIGDVNGIEIAVCPPYVSIANAAIPGAPPTPFTPSMCSVSGRVAVHPSESVTPSVNGDVLVAVPVPFSSPDVDSEKPAGNVPERIANAYGGKAWIRRNSMTRSLRRAGSDERTDSPSLHSTRRPEHREHA